jgi:hypothetical protein
MQPNTSSVKMAGTLEPGSTVQADQNQEQLTPG